MTRASILPEDPDIYMIEDTPTAPEQTEIDSYAKKYFETYLIAPFGLHYITVLGKQKPVWFPKTRKNGPVRSAIN